MCVSYTVFHFISTNGAAAISAHMFLPAKIHHKGKIAHKLAFWAPILFQISAW